jgi:DNA-binding NtrC family response regulator
MNKTILVVGDTDRWLNIVREALPVHCEICICRDEIGAFQAQEEPGNQFDLLILANHLSRENAGLEILREARAVGEHNPVIIYSDHVCKAAAAEIHGLNGVCVSPSRDGKHVLTNTVLRLLAIS